MPFYFQTDFRPKNARFPCEKANLPHCTYFTHMGGGAKIFFFGAEIPTQITNYLGGRFGYFFLLGGAKRGVRGDSERGGGRVLLFIENPRRREVAQGNSSKTIDSGLFLHPFSYAPL